MVFTKGWVYNLQEENAPSRAGRLIAIAGAFSTLATLFVILRFVVRIKTKRAIGFDDIAALSSLILAIGYSAVAILQTRWGQALDPLYFPPENTIDFSKVQYAGGPLYTLALLGFKLSLLASYLRYIGFQRTYRWIVYGSIALCTANQLIFTLVISLGCRPVAKQWNPALDGSCINTLASYYAIAGSSIGLDILIMILPIPILWNLNLNRRQKFGLTGIFSLGIFVTIIQVIRIFTIANLKHYTDSEAIVSWSIVEMNVGIIISCIPTYAPFLRWASGKISSSRRGRSSRYYIQNNSQEHGKFRSANGLTSEKSQRRISRHVPNGQKLSTPWDHQLDDMHSLPRKGATSHVISRTESEEDILRPVDGIRTTTDIRIESTRNDNPHAV